MIQSNKVIAIIQARMGSTRLPGKVMKLVNGVPLIELLLHRLSKSKEIDEVVLAAPKGSLNNPLTSHVKSLGYKVYQGSENDVLDRYYQVALQQKATIVVRITGDCPLIDPKVVDTVVKAFKLNNVDYVCNIEPPTYPDGLDVEVFSFSALKTAWKEAETFGDREHVTQYIRKSGKFYFQ